MNFAETSRQRFSPNIEEDDDVNLEAPVGLFGSVTRILTTALSVLESRLELFVIEIHELKARALAILFWGVALAFLGLMTLVAILATVVMLLWEQAFAVLLGFSGFFLVLAVVSFFMARSKLSEVPLSETVAQLKKDREMVEDELFD